MSGNIIDWNSANLVPIGDIQSKEIDREATCDFSNEDKFLAFEQNLNFKNIKKFCESLGGEVAVANDEDTLIEMQSSIRSLIDDDLCESVVYGGFENKNDNFR